METPETALLDEELSNQNQSWIYESIHSAGNDRIRVSIRRNAYEAQSYGKVEIYDPKSKKWNFLVSIAPENLAVCQMRPGSNIPVLSYTMSKQAVLRNKDLFEHDRDALIKKALLVIK